MLRSTVNSPPRLPLGSRPSPGSWGRSAGPQSCHAISQVCTNLVSAGFPSGNLVTLGPTSNDPLGSTLVVATGPIRAQYGSRLVSVYAPAVIASFGSGNARIDIRLVYPGGAAKYRRRSAGGAARQEDVPVPSCWRTARSRPQPRPGRNFSAAMLIRGCRSSSPSWPKATRCTSWTSSTSRLVADLPACCGQWTWPRWTVRRT